MSFMFLKFLFLFHLVKFTASADNEFIFNGFGISNLSLDGIASITSDGLLALTNATTDTVGHAFYPVPINFTSSTGKILSFSTTFMFSILPGYPNSGGHGMAFLVSPTTYLSTVLPSQYLGLFNNNNNGNSSNHILAVEFDTVQNREFQDIDDNHVGIDINSLNSSMSNIAGYISDDNQLFNYLTLKSGQTIQAWIDFDGEEMQLNVTLSPLRTPKPLKPLLSSNFNLSSLLLDVMYVGFSSSTGTLRTYHYILGWSFKLNGVAEELNYVKLPSIPIMETKEGNSHVLAISLSITSCLFILVIVAAIVLIVRRMRYAELLEDWELEYGPHRFSYKDLFRATKGFKEKELLGAGGFGRVYKGVAYFTDGGCS